jgi:hypothetical protein
MRSSSRIESLSYGTIYVTGCIVAALLAVPQSTQIEQTILHVISSWGYVIYWVLNQR